MSPTRILVADALPIFRAGVRKLLSRESDFDVVEASNVDEALAEASVSRPEIALIDLNLPPTGGVRAVAHLAERFDTQAIVWSLDVNHENVLAAIRAGARGYLHKEISPGGLIRSLRGLSRGEAPLSRDLASLMIGALHGLEERDRALARAAVLSAREREVLAHVARGERNRQIAQELFISEFTVKRHMQNILHKLAVPTRRDAADFYRSAFESALAPINGRVG